MQAIADDRKVKVADKEIDAMIAAAGDEKLKKELIYHVRITLGPIAMPSEIEFAESLPKTRSGKIVRRVLKAREMGMFVVSIAPGNSLEIRRYSDVFIDNLCPEGGGLLQIPGFPEKVGAAGGIVNNMLMWIFTGQFVDEMVRRGWIPWFWMGGHSVGGSAYNKAMEPFFRKRGY